MKTKTLFPLLLVLGMIVAISACKKDDTSDDATVPVITLSGANPLAVTLGGTYTEPGFTATDNVDGTLTSSVTTTGTVNTNQEGAYTLTYSVTDAAGNTGTATRTVNVSNAATYLEGTYHVADLVNGSVINYDVTLSAHSTVNNKFLLYNFRSWNYIEATISTATTFLVPSQSVPLTSITISGNGTMTSAAGVTHVNYTCTGGSDNGGSANFTKF